MKSRYFSEKLRKMGKWALLPLDTENWFTAETNHYFEKFFGLKRDGLIICDVIEGYEHAYIPESFFKNLYSYIKKQTEKDYKSIERLLETFYSFREEFKNLIVRNSNVDFKKISNDELINRYRENRRLVHYDTIFDQFGWLAEDYWTNPMELVLVNKIGLKKDSMEYNRVLFALTKPREISTTLIEKRAVLHKAILIKEDKEKIESAGKELADAYGWMPVFAYGVPWNTEWYVKELSEAVMRNIEDLKSEYTSLVEYTDLRNQTIQEILKNYTLGDRDFQLFVDFGLALDARNEAEYLVSFAGYYLLPFYDEFEKRLETPINEIRKCFESEVIQALEGKIIISDLLEEKGTYVAWGFDETLRNKETFDAKNSDELFKYAEALQVVSTKGEEFRKGVTASTGYAKGKVRIVPSPSQNDKVGQGDILITYATTVDYLPAMKRAAAIITEVGGLTCHAAVVSREFGIPCIVALKNAMKDFVDGDLVEVDADKGVVRLLKRA